MIVKHHHPHHLPVSLNYGVFAKELARAQYAIGLLQGTQGRLQNAMHLIGPLVAKEAAVSSKIEGTQSTSSDIYIFDAGGQPTFSDTPVVSNYREAMLSAIDQLHKGQKLSLHVIKALHATLLKNVRHKGVIGEFRTGPVWIGEKDGDPIEKALYVPPEHMHVVSYMENLMKYIEDDTLDLNLVKVGVIHYQFEGVHPFEDGNGRIGRLLIPLILFYKGELSLPIVYSSGYFEARPNEYREALRTVDKTGKYEEWLKFFLDGVTNQAQETMLLIDRIQNLYSSITKKYELSKSPYMNRFINFIFKYPVITIPMMQKVIHLGARLTAIRLVDQFVKDKFLFEIEGQKGPSGSKLYAFADLLHIIR